MPHKAKEVLRKLKRAGFEERRQRCVAAAASPRPPDSSPSGSRNAGITFFYFPMQKLLKITPSRSSVSTLPGISTSASKASRRSIAASSSPAKGSSTAENRRRLVGGLDRSERDMPRRGEGGMGPARIKSCFRYDFKWVGTANAIGWLVPFTPPMSVILD